MAARALLCYLCTALLLASRSARAEDAFGRQQGAVEDISGAASADASLLSALEKTARAKVVAVRGAGYQSLVDMRTDAGAIAAVRELQDVTRKLLRARYGTFAVAGGGPAGATGTVFHVKCVVAFPNAMPDIGAKGAGGTIIIETAPIELLPHAVLLFLELADAHAERDARAPAFHRNAGHVLQIDVDGPPAHRGLAFQEYDARYPHRIGVLGYAGRPGGPACYISTLDNTENHGPGSQGSKMGEADSPFGRVLTGQDVVERLFHTWGTLDAGFHVDEMGFMADPKEHAKITLSICRPGTCVAAR